MGYRLFLSCGHFTGLRVDVCPICKKAGAFRDCTCGSGAHPRRCDWHKGAYEEHIAELNAETADDEPET